MSARAEGNVAGGGITEEDMICSVQSSAFLNSASFLFLLLSVPPAALFLHL